MRAVATPLRKNVVKTQTSVKPDGENGTPKSVATRLLCRCPLRSLMNLDLSPTPKWDAKGQYWQKMLVKVFLHDEARRLEQEEEVKKEQEEKRQWVERTRQRIREKKTKSGKCVSERDAHLELQSKCVLDVSEDGKTLITRIVPPKHSHH